MTKNDNTRSVYTTPPVTSKRACDLSRQVRQKRNEFITIRVSSDLKERLTVIAHNVDRTLSRVVNDMLEEKVGAIQAEIRPRE